MSFRGNEVTVGISRKGKRSFRRPTAGYPSGRVFRVFVYDCFRFFRGGFLGGEPPRAFGWRGCVGNISFPRDCHATATPPLAMTGRNGVRLGLKRINTIKRRARLIGIRCAPPSPPKGEGFGSLLCYALVLNTGKPEAVSQ